MFRKLKLCEYRGDKNFEISSESWSKDWPNRADKNIEMIDFNKDFNWINDWYNNHFKIIIKKIIPYILLILTIITYTLLKFGINKNKINEKFLKKNYILIFLSFLFSIVWFLKFPIYRYGQSFLAILFISCFILIFNYLNEVKKVYRIFMVTTIIFALAVITKNFIRIYKKMI